MSIIYPTVPKPRTKRTYTIDGQQYPSVTTILGVIRKESLERWRGNVGNDEADRIANTSARLGTRVHALAADYALGKPVTLTEQDAELDPIYTAYTNWFDQYVTEVVSVERTVCHRTIGYAGTTDLVVVLKGDTVPTVIDLKISNYESPEWALQTAAYAAALLAEGTPIGRRLILRLDKGEQAGGFQVYEYHDYDADWFGFLAALQLYKWLEGRGA